MNTSRLKMEELVRDIKSKLGVTVTNWSGNLPSGGRVLLTMNDGSKNVVIHYTHNSGYTSRYVSFDVQSAAQKLCEIEIENLRSQVLEAAKVSVAKPTDPLIDLARNPNTDALSLITHIARRLQKLEEKR